MRGITLVDGLSLALAAALAAVVVAPQKRVRSIISAEAQIVEDLRDLDRRLEAQRRTGKPDIDGDGLAEFAPLGDVLRSRALAAEPVGTDGIYRLDGYYFAVMVPGGLRRTPVLAGSADVLADGAEITYLLVAWPEVPGETGMLAYVSSPQGVLRHQIEGFPYDRHPPAPEWPMVVFDRDRLRPNPYAESDWKSPVRLPGRK